MGRSGSKSKKLCVTNKDDTVSSEKEKVTTQKRRGRPQKLVKDKINEDEAPKMEDEDSEDTTGVPNKDINGKKRKMNGQVKEKVESVEEENGNGTKSSTEEESKSSNGLRQYRNRRKGKPRRAAEAGIECH